MLFWKIQVTNQNPELEIGSKEMEIYKSHYLKDYTTREAFSDVESQEHYLKNGWKNPLFSKMQTLTLAFVENEEIRINHFTGSEKDLLTQFLNTVKSPYFADFKIACFDSEYLLPYLGIRIDKNNIKEVIPAGLSYRNRKPWQLDSICIREYFKGAGAYKPNLKELAYIFNLEEDIDDRYEENELALLGKEDTLVHNSTEEIKLLINVYRKMHYKEALDKFKVSITNVKDVVLEEPKSILHELYETKNFDSNYKERLAKHLKSKRILKKHRDKVKEFILAVYLDKIEVMAFNKKELQEINAERTKEVEEFFNSL